MLPLTTWQLKNQASLMPEESIGDRVFSQGPLSTIAVKLESSARIGDIFKDQPTSGLHIVVQHVPSRECECLSIIYQFHSHNFTAAISPSSADADEPPTKRRRQSEDVVEEGMRMKFNAYGNLPSYINVIVVRGDCILA